MLIELKREMGPIAFSAQYQQTPIPPGGTIIKRKWLTTYDEMASRPDDRIIISWDIALSEIEFGDYSACVVLLICKEIVYILEVVRGRFPFEALKKKVMELKRRYNPSTLLIEGSPISLGLIQSLREQSINVTTYKPDTDKRARLIAQTDLFAGGSVRLPRRAGWLEEFVAELLSSRSPRRSARCSDPRPRLGAPTVESQGDSQPSPWGLLAPVCFGGQLLYDRLQASWPRRASDMSILPSFAFHRGDNSTVEQWTFLYSGGCGQALSG